MKTLASISAEAPNNSGWAQTLEDVFGGKWKTIEELDGKTPAEIMAACVKTAYYGYYWIMQTIIKHGAKVKWTPLHGTVSDKLWMVFNYARIVSMEQLEGLTDAIVDGWQRMGPIRKKKLIKNLNTAGIAHSLTKPELASKDKHRFFKELLVEKYKVNKHQAASAAHVMLALNCLTPKMEKQLQAVMALHHPSEAETEEAEEESSKLDIQDSLIMSCLYGLNGVVKRRCGETARLVGLSSSRIGMRHNFALMRVRHRESRESPYMPTADEIKKYVQPMTEVQAVKFADLLRQLRDTGRYPGGVPRRVVLHTWKRV